MGMWKYDIGIAARGDKVDIKFPLGFDGEYDGVLL